MPRKPGRPLGHEGDLAILSDEGWRAALRASAKQAGFGGPMLLGADLMRIPVRRH